MVLALRRVIGPVRDVEETDTDAQILPQGAQVWSGALANTNTTHTLQRTELMNDITSILIPSGGIPEGLSWQNFFLSLFVFLAVLEIKLRAFSVNYIHSLVLIFCFETEFH